MVEASLANYIDCRVSSIAAGCLLLFDRLSGLKQFLEGALGKGMLVLVWVYLQSKPLEIRGRGHLHLAHACDDGLHRGQVELVDQEDRVKERLVAFAETVLRQVLFGQLYGLRIYLLLEASGMPHIVSICSPTLPALLLLHKLLLHLCLRLSKEFLLHLYRQFSSSLLLQSQRLFQGLFVESSALETRNMLKLFLVGNLKRVITGASQVQMTRI